MIDTHFICEDPWAAFDRIATDDPGEPRRIFEKTSFSFGGHVTVTEYDFDSCTETAPRNEHLERLLRKLSLTVQHPVSQYNALAIVGCGYGVYVRSTESKFFFLGLGITSDPVRLQTVLYDIAASERYQPCLVIAQERLKQTIEGLLQLPNGAQSG